MNGEPATEQQVYSGAPPPGVRQIGEMQDLVSELMLAVSEAKAIPASGKVIIDREQMLQTLEMLYERLPEEMRAARWMVRERDTFVARTNERVRGMVAKARKKAEQLVSETNIIEEATEQANVLVRRSEDHAHQIRLEAEDYAEDRLERLEALLVRVLEQIRVMRTELHQTRDTGR